MNLILRTGLLIGGCLVGMLAGASWSLAERMVLEVTSQAEVRGDGVLEVRTTVSNQGDEAATNLQVVIMNLQGAVSSQTLEVLPAGQSAEFAATAPCAKASPGRYAAIVRSDSQNPNQSSMSALGFAYYHRERDCASPLVVQAQPLELQGEGQLRLRLTNTEDKAVKVTVQAFTPRELGADQATLEAHIDPQQSQDLEIGIANRTGLNKAEYPVLLLTAHESGGMHTEKVTEVKVTLAAEENAFRNVMPWWLAGLLGLTVWVVYRQLRSPCQK